MRWSCVAWLGGGMVVGAAVVGGLGMPGTAAVAQEGRAGVGAVGRYQVSAFAELHHATVMHGCYVVDTATGAVWLSAAGQERKRVDGPVGP